MIIDHFNDLPPLKDSPSTCPLDSTAITVVLHIHLEKPLLKNILPSSLPYLKHYVFKIHPAVHRTQGVSSRSVF